jgi:hypothetical protein|tara:strand:- start:26 stop:226 length:201 start_codon:yes stop_codon:yes gene_type:complete
MTKNPDAVLGTVLTTGAAAGITIQQITEYASLVVMAINIILGLGGLYLLAQRIRKTRAEARVDKDA